MTMCPLYPCGKPCSRGTHNRRNRLRFVYTHFKLCDQSLDETSFDFSYIFRAMQSCAMCAKSRTIYLNFPSHVTIGNGMVT